MFSSIEKCLPMTETASNLAKKTDALNGVIKISDLKSSCHCDPLQTKQLCKVS